MSSWTGQALAMLKAGKSLVEIGRACGVTHQCVQQQMAKLAPHDMPVRRRLAKLTDAVGQRFGKLVVTAVICQGQRIRLAANCDCGKQIEFRACNLFLAKHPQRSCGCGLIENANRTRFEGRYRKTSLPTYSRFKGVSFYINGKVWTAYITHNGVRHYLGRFDNEVEAAHAYDIAARRLKGDKALTNAALGLYWRKGRRNEHRQAED